MNESEQQVVDANTRQAENARVGYQAAVSLWISEEEVAWARFNAMLVVNSIIVAIIISLISNRQTSLIYTVSLPIVGLILCVIWFLLIKRGFDYRKYWIFTARELEERYLADPVEMVSRGRLLAEGEAVSFDMAEGPVILRLGLWARLLRSDLASYIVIVAFLLIYVVVLLLNWV